MNISSISGITPAVVPQILPAQPSKQNGDESLGTQTPKKETLIPLMEVDKKKEEKKKPDVKLEDLIMKPTPIPLEERMNQIISVEEVKDILSMVTRVPLKVEDKHKVDFKR